jgi:hypothetical protein
MRLVYEDALAVSLVGAIECGALDELRRLLARTPALAAAELVGPGSGTRTPLHVAADWPGYFPAAPEAVELLIGAGADPDAPASGLGHDATPLHWVAATDDVDVAAALVAGGADLDATGPGGEGGTPLEDAVGYGCWHVARFLVGRGARVERLWVAAAVGLGDLVDALLAAGPERDEITEAFWQACHGGQRRVAARLLDAGADPDGRPPYARDPAIGIAGRLDTRREGLIAWLAGRGAARAEGAAARDGQPAAEKGNRR